MASRIEAVHLRAVGSPGAVTSPRDCMKSYTFRRADEWEVNSMSDEGGKMSSSGIQVDNRQSESSLSRPLDAANSLNGLTWKKPDLFSTAIRSPEAYMRAIVDPIRTVSVQHIFEVVISFWASQNNVWVHLFEYYRQRSSDPHIATSKLHLHIWVRSKWRLSCVSSRT